MKKTKRNPWTKEVNYRRAYILEFRCKKCKISHRYPGAKYYSHKKYAN